jgi:hypothetical protein
MVVGGMGQRHACRQKGQQHDKQKKILLFHGTTSGTTSWFEDFVLKPATLSPSDPISSILQVYDILATRVNRKPEPSFRHIMIQNPGFFDALGVTIKARSLKEWAFMSSRADSLMSG